jgi:hypothetical protein
MESTLHPTLHSVIENNYGFFTEADVKELSEDYRYLQCLVRTGMNRYLSPLYYVPELVKDIERNGDYVRDVCLTAECHKMLQETGEYIEQKIVWRKF